MSEEIEISQRRQLPTAPGVYLFKDLNKKILYIGKAACLKDRVNSYFTMRRPGGKTGLLISQIRSVAYVLTDNEFEALLLEAEMIRRQKPPFNVVWKDDKRYLYLKIDLQSEFPRVMPVRLQDDGRSVYYGPFPSSGTVKKVIKQLRRIFPFCTQKNPGKKPCFYSFLGLCRPCPSWIKSLPGKEQKTPKALYRKNIINIKNLLDGKSKRVVRRLKKEMMNFSKLNQFEEAGNVRDQINNLLYISRDQPKIKEYLLNPSLNEDLREAEKETLLSEFKKLEAQNLWPFSLPGDIAKIEAYDISNIQGQSAAGSLVVFADGTPNKAGYRRFRIRSKTTPDDYTMMKEVLSRRMKHHEWSKPDLIIIDGGKSQISAGLEVLKGTGIPFIGLSKKLEEIVIPGRSRTTVLRLPSSSPALHLLQRIRDESHRFALFYHRMLRYKKMLNR